MLVHTVGLDPFPSNEYIEGSFKSAGDTPKNTNHFSPVGAFAAAFFWIVKALKPIAIITAMIPVKYFFIT